METFSDVPPFQTGADSHQREIDRKSLLNRLNYLHFRNGLLTIRLQSTESSRTFDLEARILPCQGEWLDFLWTEPDRLPADIGTCKIESVRLDDERTVLSFQPVDIQLDDGKGRLKLPSTALEINARSMRRYPGAGIRAQLLQNGIAYSGRLCDFSPICFRIELATTGIQPKRWLNPEVPVILTLSDEHSLLYSGLCQILRQENGRGRETCIVLEPESRPLQRFQAKEFRSVRQQLVPPPNIIFHHPLSGKLVDLKTLDLSGTGFAVEESVKDSCLVPGLIIPKLEISFGNSFKIAASAQILYRSNGGSKPSNGSVRCGATFLDIDPHQQSQLLGLLIQAQNPNVYLGSRVDQEELWRFFFESGFLYPEKYGTVQACRERFQATYRKLYSQSLDIARHFIFRERGVLQGHVSMLRFYGRAWMIHHLAARSTEARGAGLAVLAQVSRFVNECHRLPSSSLNYVFCYYRPENRFPARIFGGVKDSINDPQGCTVYPFAYLHPELSEETDDPVAALASPWEMRPATDNDVQHLEGTLAGGPGALLTEAFNLGRQVEATDDLPAEYRRLGFQLDRRLFSLCHEGHLKALFLVDLTDVGLNLADLTSSVKTFVLDDRKLSKQIFRSALENLQNRFDRPPMPVLVYPDTYARQKDLPAKKLYHLWLLNLDYLDQYFRYCSRFLTELQKEGDELS